MSTYCVYHLIHVVTPHRRIPKLFVTGVPDGHEVDWDLVDEFGEFGEFGIPHANHFVEKLTTDSDPALKRAFRAGEVARVSFDRLQSLAASV